jgi:hypothetical protein
MKRLLLALVVLVGFVCLPTMGAMWGTFSSEAYSAVQPDGSIVFIHPSTYAVWRSADGGHRWNIVNSSLSGIIPSQQFALVGLPDYKLLITGGTITGGRTNNTWMSDNNGTTWTNITTASAYPPRNYHNERSTVVLPSGDVVIVGGMCSPTEPCNDTWTTTTQGVTWSNATVNHPIPYSGQYVVALSNTELVAVGDMLYSNYTYYSSDGGATWVEQCASCGWSKRYDMSVVATSTGKIILFGGREQPVNEAARKNETWVSSDKGVTWTNIGNAPWTSRAYMSSVVLPNDTIVMMGGIRWATQGGATNEIWASSDEGVSWYLVSTSGDVTISGYVNDAETALPITAANVSATNDAGDSSNSVTPASGAYSVTGFYTGEAATFNVTAAGYTQYIFNITPLSTGISMNISLIPTTPTCHGECIGGLALDTGYLGYNNPIPSATVEGINSTALESNVTNNAGYYIMEHLANLTSYDLHGSRYGYENSTIYPVYVNGSISNFTRQDIEMERSYLQTFIITDADTLASIDNVSLVSSSGESYDTTNGTGYISEPFGLYTVTFSSSGYTTATIPYVFDSDDTHSVTMYTATPPAFNTLYSPQTVHLTIVDAYGVPQPGAYVTVSYIASSLPSTDTNWLTTNFGVDTDVAADMVNSSVLQRDYTGSDGGFVFTAFPVIRYNITAVNATTGMNHRTEITPKDSHYVIYCPLTGQARGNNTLIARQNATLPWYSLNNTHIMLGMTYQDTTSCTSSVRFRAWFQTNGSEIHNTTWSGFGSALILDNHTIPKAPIGTEYLWQYNATRVC